jgi:uncharacterized protein YodC (DUF2158 family)
MGRQDWWNALSPPPNEEAAPTLIVHALAAREDSTEPKALAWSHAQVLARPPGMHRQEWWNAAAAVARLTEMTTELQVGTIVRLKSGGPRMIVHVLLPQTVECVWCDSTGAPHRQTYLPAILEVIEPPAPADIA